tara:strand:- start:38 stop:874 length:837 start_codon:yes stop_codon:yes gene_type:complete
MKNKLEKLLYRKNTLEFSLKKYQQAITCYGELSKEIDKRLNKKIYKSNFEKYNLQVQKTKNDIELANYITSYKNSIREYNDTILIEVDKLKKDTDKIEFKNYEESAKELSNYEMFGKTTLMSPNVELPKMINDIENHIDLLDKYEKSIKEKIKNISDNYELSKHKKELFEIQNHHLTLTKRLNERKEYYLETFLPKYEKELAEAKNNLKFYLKLAQEVVDKNIDPRMTSLLEQYDNHKDEEENLWLFYTALKSRLKSIKEELIKVKSDLKIQLTRTII